MDPEKIREGSLNVPVVEYLSSDVLWATAGQLALLQAGTAGNGRQGRLGGKVGNAGDQRRPIDGLPISAPSPQQLPSFHTAPRSISGPAATYYRCVSCVH